MALTKDGLQYHIHMKEGDVGRYVLLPGDPFRTDLIASYFDDAKLVAHNREHKTWTGYLNGVKVSVTSTGMGCPSAAIALEELIKIGADTFIRVGTAGRVCDAAFDESLDGVINTAAVRDEGTTTHYIPIEYPAVADRHVVLPIMIPVVANSIVKIQDQAIAMDTKGFNAECKKTVYREIEYTKEDQIARALGIILIVATIVYLVCVKASVITPFLTNIY